MRRARQKKQSWLGDGDGLRGARAQLSLRLRKAIEETKADREGGQRPRAMIMVTHGHDHQQHRWPVASHLLEISPLQPATTRHHPAAGLGGRTSSIRLGVVSLPQAAWWGCWDHECC